MASKDSKNFPDSANWTGFVEQGVRFEGKLEVTGIFRIDGEMKGTILSDHSLVLGENARVEGQIEGNQILIAGKFDGTIFAKSRVEIQSKAMVSGEIYSPCLVILPGGMFDGNCHMIASTPVSKTVSIPVRSIQV
ncbi:MAG: bactofilin family protein [Candidatus Acidiferrales bacterium]